MLIQQFKNNSLLILDKYLPDYVIPFSFIVDNDIKFENALFMFYSIVSNTNYFDARFYHSASFEKTLSSKDILNKDFCGFSPNEIIIFNTTEKTAKSIIEKIKSTPLYKENYSDCL